MKKLENVILSRISCHSKTKMEAKYEKSRTLLLKLIVVRCDNQDYEHFRQKLRDELLKVRLQSIEGTFLFFACEILPHNGGKNA